MSQHDPTKVTAAPVVLEMTVEQLVAEAAYAFKGVVKRSHEAAMKGVPVNERTAVVTVEEVLDGPSTLNSYMGKDITVQLQRPMKHAEKATFFANPWIFGDSVAVTETGHLDATLDSATLRRQILDARMALDDERLRRALASAALVVVGTVTATNMAFEPKGDSAISFHAPQWRVALLNIKSVEKGKLEAPTAHVLYAASRDRMWTASPKFPARQEGVYLLHTDQMARVLAPFRVGGLTAIDPLDHQPLNQLERVRRLLAPQDTGERHKPRGGQR